MKTQEAIIEAIMKKLPYPEQVKDIRLDVSDAVCFKWRFSEFKVTADSVYELRGGCAEGSNTAILMRELLKPEIFKIVNPKS